ncbi:S24 family peptidase [Caballeronia sp. LZ035]|uniref:LexA family protein n=1 Tax=Caballeronia sp. LZ035 TaxID=3038568 RepID=UPI00286410CD|nr:S24 family peptidase [Caballeronia sp. LZ035]MDR5761928.1 S24 family peptidase [Caballeronia sp. LZ035]
MRYYPGMNELELNNLRVSLLRAAIDRVSNGNISEFGRRLGYKDGAFIRQMLNSNRAVSEKTIRSVEAIPGLRGWFSSTAGSITIPSATTSADAQSKLHVNPPNKELNSPLIGQKSSQTDGTLHDLNIELGPEIRGKLPLITWVQAGAWESVVNTFAIRDAEEWLLSPIPTSKSAYYLRVRGLSMYNPSGEPSFNENDLILVEPQSDAESGNLVVVLLDDSAEATFKQLIVEDGKKYLRALNPDWPNRIIEVNGNATICGVVKTKVVRY